jgi:hypothetical protein
MPHHAGICVQEVAGRPFVAGRQKLKVLSEIRVPGEYVRDPKFHYRRKLFSIFSITEL